jgi:hypothetical protein
VRQATGVMKEITDAGLDIDQGMVVKVGGQLYYDSAAIMPSHFSAPDRASSIS